MHILLLITVFFLYGYENYMRSYQIFLHETYDRLRTLSFALEKELQQVKDELFTIEADQALSKEERVAAANQLLQPILNHITAELGVTGLGYYSINLNAALAIAPWDELNHFVGYTMPPDHPGQAIYRQGVGEITQVAELPQGRSIHYLRLVYMDGMIVGHIFANLPLQPFYRAFLQSMPSFLLFFILTLIITTFLIVYIYSTMIKRSTAMLVNNIDQFSADPDIQRNDIKNWTWTEKLPLEFRGLAEKYLLLEKRIQELIRELTVSARVAALGDMVATIAHDIRNPLAVISANAEMGVITTDLERKNMFLKQIINASDQANEMLGRFMLLVRTPTENREQLDVNKLVNEVTTLVSALAAQKGIDFLCNYATGLSSIEGDAAALSQALMNILNNALEATPCDGRVSLCTYQRGNMVEIAVKDTGQGIAPELQDQIFKRFFTTKDKGTGIGLALAYSVVMNHGGKIWFSSAAGQGTTFHVQLPAAGSNIANVNNTRPL